MSPSSFHIRARRSQSTIRTISLTPAGVSSNCVLDFIIADLIDGSTNGFECIDAFGERVIVFFDIMGFIGDYPASSAVVDLKGHTATAPCTLCGFVFNKALDMSVYAYTTSITSCNTAYRRTLAKTESLRELGLSKSDHKCIGTSILEDDDFTKSHACPLLKFAVLYNKALEQYDGSLPFGLFRKDGYTLNLVAPDHLITGLIKGVLTIIFMQLSEDKDRDRLQICLRSSLSLYGFQTQSVFYKTKKKKLVPGLTMSTLYCILMVLPPTLQALGLLESLPSRRLLINLHRFYSVAFWWPSFHQDGADAWRFVHGSSMSFYHKCLQLLASNFVKSVDNFTKRYPSLSSHVDRHNVHRLLELTLHTIPLFNHIGYICELVYESAHQPLKYFLSRNHSLNSHLYSVHLILARDWLVRIYSLWTMYTDDGASEKTKHYSMICLGRLLGGKDIDLVDWSSASASPFFDELKEHIEDLLKGTVERRMKKWYQDSLPSFNTISHWELQPIPNVTSKACSFSADQAKFMHMAVSKLAELSLLNAQNIAVCNKALLIRGFGSAKKSEHERIEYGDVVQVLLKPGFRQRKFLHTSICTTGSPSFFVVGTLVLTKSGIGWAIVRECTLEEKATKGKLPDSTSSGFVEARTRDFYNLDNPNNFYFLMMNTNVRKVGVVHNCSCTGTCEFNSEARTVVHSETTLQEGRFFLLTRQLGYPARRS